MMGQEKRRSTLHSHVSPLAQGYIIPISSISTGPAWPRGYRLRAVPQRSRVRDPGPPVERHRDLYTRIVRVACNGQQYGVVNTYMLTNMSLNMILTSCL